MAFNLWTELNVNPALTWLRMERNRVLVVSSHQLQTRPKDFCTTLFLFVNIMYVLMEVWIATLFFSGSSKKSKLNLPLGFLNTETRLTWNVFFLSFGDYTLLLPNLSKGFIIIFFDDPTLNRHGAVRIQTSQKSAASLYLVPESEQ